CTAVVGVVVITNASIPPPAPHQAMASATVRVTLDHLSGIGAENAYLARVGARIRIVPLESACGVTGRLRRGDAAHRGRRQLVPWPRSVTVTEAPEGETTIVLVTPYGLAGATFKVRGRGPACVPFVGTV